MDTAATELKERVWEYYRHHGRHDLPWRLPEADGSYDASKIWVSEIMLQQTQVSRVIPKYNAFIRQFPDIQSLAAATLGDVLNAWQGLGYNRRAKFLWLAARTIVDKHAGQLPEDAAGLVLLPGIGTNTAGAIQAYAFNKPAVFVETNIRTVFLHHYFAEQTAVSDGVILEAVRQTLDYEHPREWYWALMDYGSYLKRTVGNLARYSQRYTRQSPFHGSVRQLRGRVLRLLAQSPYGRDDLLHALSDPRATEVIDTLVREELIQYQNHVYRLPSEP